MKYKAICFLLLTGILLAKPTSAQNTFQYAFGQFGIDFGYSIIRTNDNSYVITGEYDVNGAQVYMLKVDTAGELIWSNTYGRAKEMKSANGSGNRGYSVVQTYDNGFIIGGEAHSFGEGQADMYVIRTDSVGNHLWSRTLGGPLDEYCYSIIETADSCFLLAGSTESLGPALRNVYLAKLSAVGDTLWTKTCGDTFFEAANEIIEIDDGYIVAGYTYSTSSGNADFLLMKIDVNGDLIWQKSYGWEFHEFGESVIQSSDNGFVMIGSREIDISGETDVLIVKTDSGGVVEWSRSYGGSGVEDGKSVISLPDKGYAMCGFTKSFGAGQEDVLVIRTDSMGNPLWSHVIGGAGQDIGLDLVEAIDGGVVVTGSVRSFSIPTTDLYLLKLDHNGESGCHQSMINISIRTDTANENILQLSQGGGGAVDTSNTIFGTTSTIRKNVCDTLSGIAHEPELEAEIYPTLTSGYITIDFSKDAKYQIEIVDHLGRTVLNLTHVQGLKMNIDLSGYSFGMYYVEITNDGGGHRRFRVLKK